MLIPWYPLCFHDLFTYPSFCMPYGGRPPFNSLSSSCIPALLNSYHQHQQRSRLVSKRWHQMAPSVIFCWFSWFAQLLWIWHTISHFVAFSDFCTIFLHRFKTIESGIILSIWDKKIIPVSIALLYSSPRIPTDSFQNWNMVVW